VDVQYCNTERVNCGRVAAQQPGICVLGQRTSSRAQQGATEPQVPSQGQPKSRDLRKTEEHGPTGKTGCL